ncbi:MAG: peptidoglycan -binding protein [Hyphomicrobiaceae bacterium]
MARGRTARRGGEYGEFWPGYVDVLSTLLLVFTFLLSIFMIAQYFVSQEAGNKDNALRRLTRQITELTSLLSLEQAKSRGAEDELAVLRATLSSLRDDNMRLMTASQQSETAQSTAQLRIAELTSSLEDEQSLSQEALSKVDLLNQQLLALRRQIAALNEALEASEARAQGSQEQIRDLSTRLNAALARQVQELQRYRSDFFGRLRDVLRNRRDIRVVGDRFVFQSEVLFPTASATLAPEGLAAMSDIAAAIKDLAGQIPGEIDWAIQVDGHTDARPINSPQFPSNWELSTARAISVVRFLVSEGVPPQRLVAAGFGEFQPLEDGSDDETLRRNRRIELKLTNR